VVPRLGVSEALRGGCPNLRGHGARRGVPGQDERAQTHTDLDFPRREGQARAGAELEGRLRRPQEGQGKGEAHVVPRLGARLVDQDLRQPRTVRVAPQTETSAKKEVSGIPLETLKPIPSFIRWYAVFSQVQGGDGVPQRRAGSRRVHGRVRLGQPRRRQRRAVRISF